MAEERRYYDPMTYDVMRELANRLRGIYIARARKAASSEEDERWSQADRDLIAEVRAVPAMDLDAVTAMTATLRERIRAEIGTAS
ncbi:hypothetical protein KV097_18685 [Mumia sp. zg.B17]|uniref:hypothetical protein n=1 Tax=Mumia sp. zg.B17 TaxID=2855446 RepID=UPI001C6ECF7D|nr:hypothetical protein [Mumia sp. zg.B17]MBW9207970.1 hypothetical protein [Mumia sp. zg.B17]